MWYLVPRIVGERTCNPCVLKSGQGFVTLSAHTDSNQVCIQMPMIIQQLIKRQPSPCNYYMSGNRITKMLKLQHCAWFILSCAPVPHLKIAGLRSQNPLQCNTLWACRAAILRMRPRLNYVQIKLQEYKMWLDKWTQPLKKEKCPHQSIKTCIRMWRFEPSIIQYKKTKNKQTKKRVRYTDLTYTGGRDGSTLHCQAIQH